MPVAAFLTVSLVGLALASPAAPQPLRYTAAQRRLLERAPVPALIPTRVPARLADVPVVPTVDVNPGGYLVTVGGPDCHDAATVCTIASVEGRRGKLDTRGRRRVTLANGTAAWYELHACGANCAGSATVLLAHGGAVYEIDVKAGTRDDLVALANGLRPNAR